MSGWAWFNTWWFGSLLFMWLVPVITRKVSPRDVNDAVVRKAIAGAVKAGMLDYMNWMADYGSETLPELRERLDAHPIDFKNLDDLTGKL